MDTRSRPSHGLHGKVFRLLHICQQQLVELVQDFGEGSLFWKSSVRLLYSPPSVHRAYILAKATASGELVMLWPPYLTPPTSPRSSLMANISFA